MFTIKTSTVCLFISVIVVIGVLFKKITLCEVVQEGSSVLVQGNKDLRLCHTSGNLVDISTKTKIALCLDCL